MISSIIQIHVPYNSAKDEQARKETTRIYDLLNAENKLKNSQNNWGFFVASINPRL